MKSQDSQNVILMAVHIAAEMIPQISHMPTTVTEKLEGGDVLGILNRRGLLPSTGSYVERRRGAPATTAYKIRSRGSLEERRERQKLTCGSAGKESACNVGDLGSIPGLGRFPGEGKGYPLQYSGLENSIDRGAW